MSWTAKLLLAALAVLGGGLYWALERSAEDGAAVPTDAYPPGRWVRVAPTAQADGDLERVLSLPYLQGKVEAGDATGVVYHAPEASQPGVNLYCSGHAPEAFLMDMEGRVLHRWRLPFARAFPDREPDVGALYFRRVALLPGGGLLALFHGWGVVHLDRDSRLLSVLPVAAFNDLQLTREGTVLLLHKRARQETGLRPDGPVLEEFVVELTLDGEEVRRWSLLEPLLRGPYREYLDHRPDEADILHANTVTRLSETPATGGPFAPGRLLVSLRNIDTLGVLDPETGTFSWATRGGWRRQHEPVLLPSGRILLFDNLGGPNGHARVIEIDPDSGEIGWSWGERDGERLVSPEGGSVARLENGNTLITASESGRALEVSPEGKIVWEFVTPHRAGPRNELAATLWEVVRLGADDVAWLRANER